MPVGMHWSFTQLVLQLSTVFLIRVQSFNLNILHCINHLYLNMNSLETNSLKPLIANLSHNVEIRKIIHNVTFCNRLKQSAA